MGEIQALVELFAQPAGSFPKAAESLRPRLAALAQLAVDAGRLHACIISWQNPGENGIASAPPEPRWEMVGGLINVGLNRRFPDAQVRGSAVLRIGAPEVASLCAAAGLSAPPLEALAKAGQLGTINARVVLMVAAAGGASKELEALLQLVASSALLQASAAEHGASRNFWRRRATATADHLAQLERDHQRLRAETRRLDNAVAAAARLKPRGRFAGLGTLAAAMGPFDAWTVALALEGALKVVAASAALAPITPLDAASAIAESFRRQTTILRCAEADATAVYHEDRVFARYPAYACVPFEYGAIALAARKRVEARALRPVEALLGRLNPLVGRWLIEGEAERLRALVRDLGLRMFGAVDSERARIARDLHDDQAQLLAAARLALEADRNKARVIFTKLEDELRTRLREMRPATLGRFSLRGALLAEFERLKAAGVRARLTGGAGAGRLSRPIQQVCYQVAREALSNVIRHSGASEAEVSLERLSGRVRLAVSDNGRGIPERVRNRGMGLAGLTERLELLGGTLRIDSRPGLTRLCAEIPDPGQ